MKKKKGFSLIELLAVIIILAILALIVTPVIGNLIRQARIRSAVASAYGYIEAANNEIVMKNTRGENVSTDNYDVIENIIGVKYKGSGPTSGYYSVDKIRVTYGEFCINGFDIKYENGRAEYVQDAGYCPSSCTGTECNPTPNPEPCVGSECEPEIEPPIVAACPVLGDPGPEPEGHYVREMCDGTIQYNPTLYPTVYAAKAEDLVCLSKLTGENKVFLNMTVELVSNIDFSNPKYYVDSTSTAYGDINGDEVEENIYKELTTSLGFKPIKSFNGTFKGNNYSINNLYIDRTTSEVGLFGSVSDATINGVTLNCANVTGNSYTAALIGYTSGATTIASSTINNSEIKGTSSVGALVGKSSTYNPAIFSNTTINDSKIEGTSNVGGVVGSSMNVTILNTNLNDIEVIGENNYIGGIVGDSFDTIKNVNINGIKVKGKQYIGGIKGKHTNNDIVGININGNCYIEGTENVGGIVGWSSNDVALSNIITDNFNVSGTNYVGGIVGFNTGIIYDIEINKVNVEGLLTNIGGVVGFHQGGLLTHINANNVKVSTASDATSVESIGGIIGDTFGAPMTNINVNKIEINANKATFVGGIAGKSNGTVANVSADKIKIEGENNAKVGGVLGYNGTILGVDIADIEINLTSSEIIGGIVGYNNSRIEGTNIANVNISASDCNYVGGGIGSNHGKIKETTIRGSVDGKEYVGGVAGEFYYGTVESTISNVNITGNTLIGGLTGYSYSSAINSCIIEGGTITKRQTDGVLAKLIASLNYGTINNNKTFVSTAVVASSSEGTENGTLYTASDGNLAYFSTGTNAILETASTTGDENETGYYFKTDSTGKIVAILEDAFAYKTCEGIEYNETTYKIKTVEDLGCIIRLSKNMHTNAKGENFKGKTILLENNIDINDPNTYANSSDTEFQSELKLYLNSITTTGRLENPFLGTFDGQGHTIKNLTNSLFGTLGKGSIVKNLTIDTSNLHQNSPGSPLATYSYGSTVSGVTVTNFNVNTTNNKGGIITEAKYSTLSTITLSNSNINLTSYSYYLGGIVATGVGNSIIGVTLNNNTITGSNSSWTGGIIGNGKDNIISNVTVNNTKVNGNDFVAYNFIPNPISYIENKYV